MDIVLVTKPESNGVKLLLKVTDFDDRLRLADIHHFPKEDQTGVKWLPSLLLDEREIHLVSKEGLVRQDSDMVLEDIQNQLIDDAQLDFETTDESDVASCIAIEADHLSR